MSEMANEGHDIYVDFRNWYVTRRYVQWIAIFLVAILFIGGGTSAYRDVFQSQTGSVLSGYESYSPIYWVIGFATWLLMAFVFRYSFLDLGPEAPAAAPRTTLPGERVAGGTAGDTVEPSRVDAVPVGLPQRRLVDLGTLPPSAQRFIIIMTLTAFVYEMTGIWHGFTLSHELRSGILHNSTSYWIGGLVTGLFAGFLIDAHAQRLVKLMLVIWVATLAHVFWWITPEEVIGKGELAYADWRGSLTPYVRMLFAAGEESNISRMMGGMTRVGGHYMPKSAHVDAAVFYLNKWQAVSIRRVVPLGKGDVYMQSYATNGSSDQVSMVLEETTEGLVFHSSTNSWVTPKQEGSPLFNVTFYESDFVPLGDFMILECARFASEEESVNFTVYVPQQTEVDDIHCWQVMPSYYAIGRVPLKYREVAVSGNARPFSWLDSFLKKLDTIVDRNVDEVNTRLRSQQTLEAEERLKSQLGPVLSWVSDAFVTSFGKSKLTPIREWVAGFNAELRSSKDPAKGQVVPAPKLPDLGEINAGNWPILPVCMRYFSFGSGKHFSDLLGLKPAVSLCQNMKSPSIESLFISYEWKSAASDSTMPELQPLP